MLGQGMHRSSEINFKRHPPEENIELKGMGPFLSGVQTTSVGFQNKSNEYKKVEEENMARLRLNPKMSPFLMSALPMQK